MGEWPMADRALELRRIRTLMLDGTARGVILAAPAGIGKTRLAREAFRVAEEAGFTTL